MHFTYKWDWKSFSWDSKFFAPLRTHIHRAARQHQMTSHTIFNANGKTIKRQCVIWIAFHVWYDYHQTGDNIAKYFRIPADLKNTLSVKHSEWSTNNKQFRLISQWRMCVWARTTQRQTKEKHTHLMRINNIKYRYMSEFETCVRV